MVDLYYHFTRKEIFILILELIVKYDDELGSKSQNGVLCEGDQKVLKASLSFKCKHMRSWPIYLGALYLAEMIIRYGYFQNRCECLHFNTP